MQLYKVRHSSLSHFVVQEASAGIGGIGVGNHSGSARTAVPAAQLLDKSFHV